MIISHKHKFVFTRPMRVGSSSTQAIILNSGLIGKDDYHTGAVENMFSEGFLSMNLPKNYIKDLTTKAQILTTKAKLIHATPEILFSKGLLTETQMKEYTFISIFREPIERYISAWVYEVIGVYFPGDSLKELCLDIASGEQLLLQQHACNRDYFYFQGKVLPNIKVLRTESLFTDLIKALSNLEGVSLVEQHIKKGNYPSWAKEKYTSWLSKEQVQQLHKLLEQDFNFQDYLQENGYAS